MSNTERQGVEPTRLKKNPGRRAVAGAEHATAERAGPSRKRLTKFFLDEWRLQVCAVTSARLQTRFVTRKSSNEQTSAGPRATIIGFAGKSYSRVNADAALRD